MLNVVSERDKELLLSGSFGLEKESLRVSKEGFLSHSRHPFSQDNEHIVRDFCENQTEINTPVCGSAKEAVDKLSEYTNEIYAVLNNLPEPELLWPFSNPPFIRNEADVPVAIFKGKQASKTEYREYLSDRYGRYKMTFSGIHVNYSFNGELLQNNFELSAPKHILAEGKDSQNYQHCFRSYKDNFYLKLTEKMVAYGWILTAITAASPILNRSFIEKGVFEGEEFTGMGSVRCSEMGYWNSFAPIFDYGNIPDYVSSIQRYVDEGFLKAPSELYYPIRVKPVGENSLENLLNKGVSHIEMRMFDLNPLRPEGVDVRDVEFVQLLAGWLAATPAQPFTKKDQVQAVANFKNAARYDLKTVKIVVPNGEVYSVANAALKVLGFMKDFYRDYPDDVQAVLEYQEAKFTDPDNNRYAWLIRDMYMPDFVKKGIVLAKDRQGYAGE
jgi:glutamate--cysteine ligase